MKKILLIIIILSLTIPQVLGCISFLDINKQYFVFLDIEDEDAMNKYYYNKEFYTNDEFRTLNKASNYSIDDLFIGNNHINLGLDYELDCLDEDKVVCQSKLRNALDDLKKQGIIEINEEDLSEIIKISETNTIIIKAHKFKIGFLQSKKRWINYYDSTCYSSDDVSSKNNFLFGKKVTISPLTKVFFVIIF